MGETLLAAISDLTLYFPAAGFPFQRSEAATQHKSDTNTPLSSPSSLAGNHDGEGGLWHLGDARRSRRVDLDGGGRARGAVAGRRQPPSASRRPFAKAGGVIGCCSQAAADKDMNNIPAQAVAARAAAGGAISTHSRHRCTCVLPLPPNSAPLSSTRAHPIIRSQADCGMCCAMPTHQTLARA